MLDDLIRFLTARLNEDEAVFDKATEAEAEQLRHDGMPTTTAAHIRDYWLNQVPHATQWPRWLAEVQAKRRIMKMHQPGAELCYWSHDSSNVHGTDDLCPTVLVLASIYQDHPDFHEGWRP